jgi:hypothetical protein
MFNNKNVNAPCTNITTDFTFTSFTLYDTAGYRLLCDYHFDDLLGVEVNLNNTVFSKFSEFLDYDKLALVMLDRPVDANYIKFLVNTVVKQYQEQLVGDIRSVQLSAFSKDQHSWDYLKPHIANFVPSTTSVQSQIIEAVLMKGGSIRLDGQLLIDDISSQIFREFKKEIPKIISGDSAIETVYNQNKRGGRLSTPQDIGCAGGAADLAGEPSVLNADNNSSFRGDDAKFKFA